MDIYIFPNSKAMYCIQKKKIHIQEQTEVYHGIQYILINELTMPSVT